MKKYTDIYTYTDPDAAELELEMLKRNARKAGGYATAMNNRSAKVASIYIELPSRASIERLFEQSFPGWKAR